MTKYLTESGGTRAHRRLVAAALARDGYTCQMLRDGAKCGRPATTGNHKIPRVLGGANTLENMEAACVPCNMGAGARLRGAAGEAVVARHNNVLAIVTVLDRLGAPCDLTVNAARMMLAIHSDHPWRAVEIVAACGHRRGRGPLTRI